MKVNHIITREDGSQVKIVAELFTNPNLTQQPGTFVMQRPNQEAPWRLLGDSARTAEATSGVEDYIERAQPEMFKHVSPGEILRANAHLMKLANKPYYGDITREFGHMSDRTTVELYVRKSDSDAVLEHLQKNRRTPEAIDTTTTEGVELEQFMFSEIDGGELGCESWLKEQRIPYDKYWGEGCEYAPGVDHFRINDEGEGVIVTLIEGESRNVPLRKLKEAEKAGKNIADVIAEHEESMTVLSWESQLSEEAPAPSP